MIGFFSTQGQLAGRFKVRPHPTVRRLSPVSCQVFDVAIATYAELDRHDFAVYSLSSSMFSKGHQFRRIQGLSAGFFQSPISGQ